MNYNYNLNRTMYHRPCFFYIWFRLDLAFRTLLLRCTVSRNCPISFFVDNFNYRIPRRLVKKRLCIKISLAQTPGTDYFIIEPHCVLRPHAIAARTIHQVFLNCSTSIIHSPFIVLVVRNRRSAKSEIIEKICKHVRPFVYYAVRGYCCTLAYV